MKNIGRNGTISLLLLFAPAVCALEANSTLVDQVEVSVSQHCNQVMLHFYAPVVYLNHFPLSKNKLFQVRIKTIYDNKEERRKKHLRHIVSTPRKPATPLLAINYEDNDGEPYFIIEFNKDVHLSIQQTKDYRSLQLRFSATEEHCSLNETHTQ